MHAAGMTVLDPRTPGEWRVHMAEEERPGGLFDRLVEAGADPDEVSRLRAEHAFYEVLLDAGKPLPAGNEPMSVDAHGAVEDGLCYAFREEILGGDAEGGVRTAGSAMGYNYGALSAKIDAAASADAAARKKRTDQTNAKLDDWGKAVDSVLPGAGTWLATESKLALAVEGAVVRWVQGDWDSDEQKARALAAVKKALESGDVPKPFNAEEDFAKTYADDLESEIGRLHDFEEPWQAALDDYRASLLANVSDQRILSLAVRTAGFYSLEFGTQFLCEAVSAGGDPGKFDYALADLVAAVASARFGTSYPEALKVAYAAVPVVASVHPTICTGRGYKGGSDSWEYDHGPMLYVLQAWLALSPKAHVDALTGKAPASSDPYAGKMTAPSSSSALPWLLGLGAGGYVVWRYVL
jgi:hypothetical protein